MGLWEIVLPQATTNLITNPSFETGTTGWTATAGSLSRVTTDRRFGLYSLSWTPASGTSDSVYFGTVTMIDGSTYTFSVYVLAPITVPYRLYVGSTGGSVLGTPTTFVGTGDWQRVQVTYQQPNPDASRRLYLAKNGSSNVQAVLIDGAMCEGFDTGTWTGSFAATTYCDGSVLGCAWSGQAHASTSSRSAQTALGGLVVNLDALNVYVLDWPGAGMPPVTNVATELAMADGAVYQRTLAKPRVFTLKLTAYNPNSAGSLAGLHAIRQALINAIKPDRLGQQQPFILQYNGAGSPIRLSALYDAGLEWGERKGFTEDPALRLIAYDPYWYSEFDDGQTLTANSSLSNSASILKRSSGGTWGKLGTGLNSNPLRAYLAPDSSLYVVGAFTTAGGTTVNYVAKWNGSSWSAMGTTGLAGGTPTGRGVCSDGTTSGCYVFGKFTTAGGVTANSIARWSGSAWSAMGGTPGVAGGTATVYDAILHPNGKLYIAGNFTSAGGTAASFCASWDGSTWAALGAGLTGGGGAEAKSVTLGADGKVYYSGSFTSPYTNNAAWDPISSAWSAVGGSGGPQADPGTLVTLIDGTIVAGAAFSDPVTALGVEGAQYNGAAWSRLDPLSLAANANFNMIRADLKQRGVWIAATTLQNLPGFGTAYAFAYWNGTAYLPLDVYVGAIGRMIHPFSDGSLLVGFDGSVTALAAGVTTVTNEGTAAAYPRISITGPGQLISIVNNTTGDALYFVDLTLQSGETLVIDLRVGIKTFVSNLRTCLSYLSPVSNISTFRLLPGDNSVAVLVNNASASASMVWTERHWSIDGGSA